MSDTPWNWDAAVTKAAVVTTAIASRHSGVWGVFLEERDRTTSFLHNQLKNEEAGVSLNKMASKAFSSSSVLGFLVFHKHLC